MSYKRETLEAKTSKQLKSLCTNRLGLPGMWKKTKNDVIDAILEKYGTAQKKARKLVAKKAPKPLTGVTGDFKSTMTKPGSPWGERIGTTIQVSCGANTGKFPVAGRTVAAVGEFLREVLNVDKLSTGLVNGKEASGTYKIKKGDVIEFLKPAGQKG